MLIGSHVSIKNGLIGAAKEAYSYGANTFMVYTGAPQNTVRRDIKDLKVLEGKKFMEENNIYDFVVHAPYIINLATYIDDKFKFATDFLKEEIRRTELLGSKYLVLHPGAYTQMDKDYGINRIAYGINSVLEESTNLYLCLETMAGKGTEIGRNFSELSEIIEKVELKEKVGICFDTCHVHDSGYDIVNSFENVLAEFDNTIGKDKIKVFHLNGSLNKMGAKKDRHANIGAGEENAKGKDFIGLEALKNIIKNPVTKGIPLILETPWIDDKTNLYKEEIRMLKDV